MRYSSNLFTQKVSENVLNYCQPAIQRYHHLSLNLQNEIPLKTLSYNTQNLALLQNPSILQISENITRSLTKFSLQKGKRKSVKAVLKRFYRLDWGCWIRTKSGRNKKIWKKTAPRRRRLRQHVLTNSTQSWLLDKMVTKFWRRPKYYVDDPYETYHQREEFSITRKKPV